MDFNIVPNIQADTFNLQELTWHEVKDTVAAKNPELFQAIESLEPDENLTLLKVRYPYGSMIIDNGIVHLPHKSGKAIPINSSRINEALKKKLSYACIPLGLLLNKASEVFVKAGERIIPLKFLAPGDMFGLFEVINLLSGLKTEPIWCVSSGARSIFMLPKIADKIGYHRLKRELNIPLTPPRSLADHWEIFRQIANHPKYINDWGSEVLFFTEAWFNKPINDSKWAVFYNYLFRESNIHSQYTRDDTIFNLTWHCFAVAIGNRNLRPRPYLADTVKHLVAVATGALPAYRPADQSEIAAPTKLLQDSYIHCYGLKNYLPTIMHPHNLMRGQESRPIYYSLSFPSLIEGVPQHKQNQEIITDLREVKLLIDTLYGAIKTGKILLPKAHSLLTKFQFDYFHSGSDIYNEIQHTKTILAKDPSLATEQDLFNGKEFCPTAPFLSGCVMITYMA